jgi:hypothetical protein
MHVVAARMVFRDKPAASQTFVIWMGSQDQQGLLADNRPRIGHREIAQHIKHSIHAYHGLQIAPNPGRKTQHCCISM